MAYIQRRKNPRGVLTWQVRWETPDGDSDSETCDYEKVAKKFKSLVEVAGNAVRRATRENRHQQDMAAESHRHQREMAVRERRIDLYLEVLRSKTLTDRVYFDMTREIQ